MREARSPALELAARVVHGGEGGSNADLLRTLEAARTRLRGRHAAERFGPNGQKLRVALRAFEAALTILPVLQTRVANRERS